MRKFHQNYIEKFLDTNSTLKWPSRLRDLRDSKLHAKSNARAAYRVIAHNEPFLFWKNRRKRDFVGTSQVYPDEVPVNRTFRETLTAPVTRSRNLKVSANPLPPGDPSNLGRTGYLIHTVKTIFTPRS